MLLAAILFGIIEGLTEFLPISSTGHLLLAERWLGRKSDLFFIVIQCGAVLAVLPLFPERCRQAILGWRDPAARGFLLKILFAFAVTGAGGLALEWAPYRLPESAPPVAFALIAGGALFIAVERRIRGRPLSTEVNWMLAFLAGLSQLLAAVFPGASRSGLVIIFFLVCGVSRTASVEFSFLLGVPTILSAGALKILEAVRQSRPGGPAEDWGALAVAAIAAAVVSFAAVKWLLGYVRVHTFRIFGWYRIAIGAAVLLAACFPPKPPPRASLPRPTSRPRPRSETPSEWPSSGSRPASS